MGVNLMGGGGGHCDSLEYTPFITLILLTIITLSCLVSKTLDVYTIDNIPILLNRNRTAADRGNKVLL